MFGYISEPIDHNH